MNIPTGSMKTLGKTTKTIIVLGFSITALGTLRGLKNLKSQGFSIILLGIRDGHKIALKSNIPDEKYIVDADSIVDALLIEKKKFRGRPALLFTQDDQIVDISWRQDELKDHYSFLLPDSSQIDLLMEKTQFTSFALNNDLKIPETTFINNSAQLSEAAEVTGFPLIIKPYLKHALKAHNQNDLKEIISNLKPVNYKSCIAQKFIPGKDDNLFFCFLLFDSTSNLVCHMLAQKLRQWPISHGTTSLARTVSNERIMKHVERFFKCFQIKGFCSIEFKYDADTDDFYIMEPTIGRFNQQVALTYGCGVNFPVIFSLTLLGLEPDAIPEQRNDVYWIYESNDWFSYRKSPGNNYGYLRNYRRNHVNVLMSGSDPGPVFYEISSLFKKKLKKIFAYVRTSRNIFL